MGFVLAVVAHAANLHDTVSGLLPLCVAKDIFPTIIACCADSGYRVTFATLAAEKPGVGLILSSEPGARNGKFCPNAGESKGLLPGLATSEDYQRIMKKTVASAMAFVYLANIRILLKRIMKSL